MAAINNDKSNHTLADNNENHHSSYRGNNEDLSNTIDCALKELSTAECGKDASFGFVLGYN